MRNDTNCKEAQADGEYQVGHVEENLNQGRPFLRIAQRLDQGGHATDEDSLKESEVQDSEEKKQKVQGIATGDPRQPELYERGSHGEGQINQQGDWAPRRGRLRR